MTEHATPNHVDRAHALLSASSSGIWTLCAAAARVNEAFPDEESEFASEGTIAHELVEIGLKAYRDQTGRPADFDDARYTKEMHDGAIAMREMLEAITEPLRLAGEPYAVLIEQRLDFSRWVPEGFGTGDLCVVSKKTLWLIDYKFGKGITVEAEDNPQLKLYGLGALEELGFAYDEIENVVLMICQPRKNNFPEWSTTKTELLAWADSIKPAAEKAFNLHDPAPSDFVPGEHCSKYFCRARFTCKARADHNLSIATSEFEDDFGAAPLYQTAPNQLTEAAIADLLPLLPAIEKWAKELQEFAQKQAIELGVKYPGYKVVEGRSNRYITDVMAAVRKLKEAGFEEADILKDPALIGITELEKLVGKKQFAVILDGLIGKPKGKPTLVPASDKRSEWEGARNADDDFA